MTSNSTSRDAMESSPLLRNITRCAMIFAHPAHELPAAGLMQELQPSLLFLTRADGAGDEQREELARHGLRELALIEKTTFLGVREHDIYRWILNGDVDPFFALRAQIMAWLETHRPDAIFGDAFELTNVVHDVGRLLVDSAWREFRKKSPCRNFELPLVCRTEPELWKLRVQEFPGDTPQAFYLDTKQQDAKAKLAAWAGQYLEEAALGRELFSLEQEIFREVPSDRDYTKPPNGLRLHYDEWGKLQVLRGKYTQPILFDAHFVPLVRKLPLMLPAIAD